MKSDIRTEREVNQLAPHLPDIPFDPFLFVGSHDENPRLGSYLEDYAYLSGAGTLDQYNGRFTVTPDYPQGTYAYFATLDASGGAAYSYLVGPTYYGAVATDNLSPTGITVPGETRVLIAPLEGVGRENDLNRLFA